YDISKQKYDNSEGQVGTIDSYETLFKNQRVGYEKIQRMEREQYSLNWEGNWDLGKSIIGIHQIESANFGRSLPLNAEQRKLILDNKR
ncbi:TonB-dependent receptor, partial [Aliarcobacter butzleri]